MSFFQIEGGNPLKGKVKLSGAKNAAIKMIVASLLTDEDVILEDVPEISDVEVDIEILRSLGVEALYIRPNVLKLSSKKIHLTIYKRNYILSLYLSYRLISMLDTQYIKNLTDLRLDPAGIIKLTKQSDNPVYIFNRGKPVSVILDVKIYEEMVDRLEDAMDALEMREFEKKPKKKTGWITQEKLIRKLKKA